ncbi:MAG: hypothetical protein N7Q72_04370 [Spiroplasma sp. Tabriz.8]|nr:hypothetical protein [Spiroplasma sp. Tabriz.8]
MRFEHIEQWQLKYQLMSIIYIYIYIYIYIFCTHHLLLFIILI